MAKSPKREKKRDTRIVKRSTSNESAASIAQGGAESRAVSPETALDAPANLFDLSVLMIYCKTHDKYALKEVNQKKNGLWFPYAVGSVLSLPDNF